MGNLTQELVQLLCQRWWLAAAASSAVCAAAACTRIFEPEARRLKRTEQKKKKDLRALVDKIVQYGRTVRRQFPNGAVVVSERDLAEQLRKRPDYVITELHVLLNEHKVQRTQLTGYWKLKS